MCYMISRSYTCGHLLNVEFMCCTKYEGFEKLRCCLTLGKPDADVMPQACKKCIDQKMNNLKPFEKLAMWEKCRKLWKKELEDYDKREAMRKAQEMAALQNAASHRAVA